MIGAARKIRTLLSVHFAEMVEFRAELFFWMVATGLPLIMMGIWVPAAGDGKFDMTGPDVARYYLAVFFVRQFTIVWVIYHFEWLVVTGRLSSMLLQPIHPLFRFFFAHLSEQAARLPIVIVMIVAVVLIYPAATQDADGAFWLPSWIDVLTVVGLIYFTLLLRYLLQCILCTLAFWTERSSQFETALFLPYMYLSGLFAPLEAFDEPVRDVVLWTPFPYMLWFPANVLTGRETVPLWQGFLVMAAWAAIFWIVHRILWKLGLKQYSAMGA